MTNEIEFFPIMKNGYWLIEGVKYLAGSAGSLILCCDKCGEEHFRDVDNYFLHTEWHKCMTCRNQMQPVKEKEMFKKWYPIWMDSEGVEGILKGSPS